MDNSDLTPDSEYDGPSKSQKKREMHELQALGERLVELSADRLKQIDLPDSLRDAICEARRITSHGARRRQLQFVGKLMRNVDPEPIRERLSAWDGSSRAEIARMHRLERLRDDLLADEKTLEHIAAAFPAADLTHLRQLRRAALKEREAQKPPKNYRVIFQILRDLDSGTAETPATEHQE